MGKARVGLFCCAAALSVAGCGAEPGSESSGPDSIGGADQSARKRRDAGTPPDAGIVHDAGSTSSCNPDACPAPNGGLTWACEKRFAYGANWAWINFGGDFGGIPAWGQNGVAASSATVSAEMASLKSAGVDVIRWWMFPRFLTPGVTFGVDGAPSGTGGTIAADIQQALALAEANNVYLVLTLFSFDNFNPTAVVGGLNVPGLGPIVKDPMKTHELVQNLVIQVAKAAEASSFKSRLLAWDIINEPEWAMTGPNMYGGEDFTPTAGLDTVTHAQMESFANAVADGLHSASSARVTVGSAAIKWARAWTHAHLDFYQLHYYGWIYQWYPYQKVTLQSVGLTDKPVLLGEYPDTGLPAQGFWPAKTPEQFSQDMWSDGYAGTLAWSFNDPGFPWNASAISPFAAQYPCQTVY